MGPALAGSDGVATLELRVIDDGGGPMRRDTVHGSSYRA